MSDFQTNHERTMIAFERVIVSLQALTHAVEKVASEIGCLFFAILVGALVIVIK